MPTTATLITSVDGKCVCWSLVFGEKRSFVPAMLCGTKTLNWPIAGRGHPLAAHVAGLPALYWLVSILSGSTSTCVIYTTPRILLRGH